MKKFCTRCGRQFEAVGREVICPSCKAAAAEEVKRAAVLRAKRASWTGESVPVRISGRASTVIREYGTAHNLPFAAALDDLLKASDFFVSTGKAWEEVEPYKSHRRDKTTSTTEAAQEAKQVQAIDELLKQTAQEEVKQETQEAKQEVKTVKTAAKAASKASASKATTSKASASKASASKK